MKIVITGGSGLIGRALTESLTSDGVDVVILSRDPGRVTGLPKGAIGARWDGATAALLAPLLEGADAVVNLAGENIGAGRWTPKRKRAIRDSRLRVTAALVDALRQVDRRPQVLIQASAVGFYGPSGDDVLTEAEPPGTDFLASVCLEWERASAAVEGIGIRRVVVRSGVVLDGRSGALPRILLPFRFFGGGPVGTGRQWFPWIHIDDEVRAIEALLRQDDAEGAFNLTAPEPVTNLDLATAVGRMLGRPSFLPTPAFALELLLGEMSTLVLDGQRAVPRRLLDLGFEFGFREIEPALRDLLTS